MNVLTDTWRGLVQRRLLPVALLLVAAAAAVPFLLAKDEPAAPPAPVAVASTSGSDVAKPIVAVASSQQREIGRGTVIGSRKNPFRPAVGAKKGTASSASDTATSGTAKTQGGTGTKPGGTVIVPGTGVGVSPGKRKAYELYTIKVRFGESSSDDLGVRNLRRLKALPSVAEPVLIYLGLLSDAKTAVFMVESGVVVQGDGVCKPSPDNCQTLHLKEGETEFLDVLGEGDTEGATGGKQYQLDLVKIRRAKTSSASAARRAYTAEASGGRKALRSRMGRVGRYRYDAESGTLKRIGTKAWKAQVARAAAR